MLLTLLLFVDDMLVMLVMIDDADVVQYDVVLVHCGLFQCCSSRMQDESILMIVGFND